MSNQYSSIADIMGAPPSWVSQDDRERIAAYQTYEDIYWNVPGTFKLMQRGSEDAPLYLPSGRIMIEATNRFLAKGFKIIVHPDIGTDEDKAKVQLAFDRLFRRENFYTKFETQRRFGLIRGDAVWHVVADPTKPAGSRISIYDIDPASYFPIYDEDNLDRMIGCHLVEITEDEKGKRYIRRQTYRKQEGGRISSELTIFEEGAWDDRGREARVKKVATPVPEFLLPAAITALPVYHIKNIRTPGDPFGSSEIRGLERIIAGVNQSISDEELALALDGLGVYFTNSGPPVDEETGEEGIWRMGPGSVLEIDEDSTMGRVSGVGSVTPFLDHIRFIMGEGMKAAGVPNVAAGQVEVTAAESGISLALQLSPLLAKNSEKETEMLGVYDHMAYDILHGFMVAYEGMNADTTVEMIPLVMDPMPVNRDARVKEIVSLVTAKVMSLDTAHEELRKIGIEIPGNEIALIMGEQRELSDATAVDVFTDRAGSELGGFGA